MLKELKSQWRYNRKVPTEAVVPLIFADLLNSPAVLIKNILLFHPFPSRTLQENPKNKENDWLKCNGFVKQNDTNWWTRKTFSEPNNLNWRIQFSKWSKRKYVDAVFFVLGVESFLYFLSIQGFVTAALMRAAIAPGLALSWGTSNENFVAVALVQDATAQRLRWDWRYRTTQPWLPLKLRQNIHERQKKRKFSHLFIF